MYKGLRIAAVVPAHNEAAHIKEVIVTMPDIVDVIAITDDLSSDETSEIARSSGDARVIVTRHEKNTGVGGAIKTAHSIALQQKCQINVVFAGDGQMDPDYLTRLLDPVVEGRYGYAKGNRLFSRTSHSGMPGYRVFGNYVLSYMHKAVSGYWHISDPQNGYTAIRADILNEINYETISGGYEFENDLLSRLNEFDIPVIDVEIPARYRDEVSDIKLTTVIPALLKNFVVSYWGRMLRKHVLRNRIIPCVLLLLSAVGLGAAVIKIAQTHFVASALFFVLSACSLSGVSIYDFLSEPKSWSQPRTFDQA